MKKLVLMASFMMGIGAIAIGQPMQRSPEQRAAHMTKVLTKRLNLTNAQARQINTVFYTQATRMDSLRNNRSADKKSNHLAARSIMLAGRQKIVALLNDTQKQQFMAWVKMRKERHRERMESMGSGS